MTLLTNQNWKEKTVNRRYTLFLVGVVLLLGGCAAIQSTEKGATVELVNEKPQGNCKALGEVIGSQGNWFNGDYTSNENLMLGARNDLRNKGAALGGNVVYVQNLSNSNAWGSMGTTNTTVVGQVYICK